MQEEVITLGALMVDPAGRRVTIAAKDIELSRKEFALLLVLAAQPDRVFSKEELLATVWGHNGTTHTRTLDSHASRLRRRLRAAGAPGLNFLHGLFAFAEKRGWSSGNAVAEAERPRAGGADPDIRFIDLEELEALIREVPEDVLGAVERPLYLTAAMTGLRQGELIALRWKDVDWKATLIRVRRNYTRGRFGTPKTKRSSRSVPMPARVAAALKEHFKGSEYTGADDLVFCHPETGGPFDASKMRKRFKAALKAAGVRSIRFHDLRHTFGTKMAAAGAPLRTIQEWMGHRDYKTTEIYADYAPDPVQGARWAEAAFAEDEEEDDDATDDENEAGKGE